MFKPKSIVFFLFSVLLIVTSCKKKDDSILNTTFQIPETRDTFNFKVLEAIPISPNYDSTLHGYSFFPHYFGKENEIFYQCFNSYHLFHHLKELKPKNDFSYFEKHFVLNYFKKNFQDPGNGQLSILIDTLKVSNKIYPVYIYNPCFSKFIIGFDYYLYLIIEVKQKNNVWIELNHFPKNACGEGRMMILPPKEICLTYLPELKKGNFKTEFRLRLRNAYSESYPVSIDESILENIEH
ncbi:MAG: hypothetical protein ACK476_07715 [Fluviicola sp.]